MIIKIYKAIVLLDDTLELLEPNDVEQGVSTNITMNGISKILRCSSDGIIRFTEPDVKVFPIPAMVMKENIKYILKYTDTLQSITTDYFYPIGEDWIYEENGIYKYNALADGVIENNLPTIYFN